MVPGRKTAEELCGADESARGAFFGFDLDSGDDKMLDAFSNGAGADSGLCVSAFDGCMPTDDAPGVDDFHLVEVLYSRKLGYTLAHFASADGGGNNSPHLSWTITMRGPDGDELLDLSLQQLGSEDEEDLLTDEPCSFYAQISSEVARKLADSGIALGLQLDESSGSNVLRPASNTEEALDALLAGTELDEGQWGGAPRNLGSKNRYMLTVVHRTTRLTGCCFLRSSGRTLKVPTRPHVPIRAVHDIPSLLFFDNLAEAISVDIVNRTTVMLRRSGLPAEFWPSAARHIVWLINYRTMHDPVVTEVPGMRYWGEKVLVRAEHRVRRCKLDRCLRVGYWLGFSENGAALRIFYPLTGRICVEDRAFVFDAP
jgi:hypothetical protein